MKYTVQDAHRQIVNMHAQMARLARTQIENRDLRHCTIKSVTYKDSGWKTNVSVGMK